MPLVQVVIDDSTSKTITGQYRFLRADGGVLEVPHGTAFPASPEADEFFWRDDLATLYKRNAANTTWEASTAVPVAHHVTHENGGADEISVGGLSGVLADPQTPTAHAASHGSGQADQLAHGALFGAGTNAHATIDTHLASTSNPHSTTASQVGAPPTSRTITAGSGLTGGGDLSADRTLNVGAHVDGSIVVAADTVQVGTLASDAQHGSRGGGTQHAVATTSVAGFESAADKTKLDGIAAGATNTPLSSTAPVNVKRVASSAGAGTSAARDDHQHDIDVGTPSDIGTANTQGSASSLTLSDHGHRLPFATVQTVLGGATGAIGVNGQKITSLGTPTVAADAATKAYVDGVASGLQIKAAVKAVATSAVASLSGLATTVDGVPLDTDGMRVLLTAQGTATQNGIWAVHSGAWTRPTDFAAGLHAAAAFCFVERGTSYLDSGWVCTTNGPSDVIDTDPLAWTQFSGAGQITAGAGLTKTGNTLNVGANADGSITVNTDDIQIGTLASDAQHGSRGGGTQHAVATTSVAGFESAADKAKLDGLPSSAPPTTRTLTAGAGLTGGGDLSADRTFTVGANADGSITVHADDIQVGVLASDAQHGVRGGGTQHAVATAAVAGFLSAADKSKLDGISGAAVFGADQQYEAQNARTTTTSNTYQGKTTLTTPALTGTYRVAFTVVLDQGGANQFGWTRLYNSTDAAVLYEGNARPSAAAVYTTFSGFARVTFTGAAKTFILQFRSGTAGQTTGCAYARIEFWRVA
jgi:hypothetical protein